MGRLLRFVVPAIVLSLLFVAPVSGADPNLVKNGSFEDGFVDGVGKGWAAFNNGGHSSYGYAAETSKSAVWDGASAQVIGIKSSGVDGDRYSGIFQAVDVVPNTTYRLTLHGMVRSSEGPQEKSGYGYRMQWAIDYGGGTDWSKLDAAAWKELNWYEWPLASPGYVETFTTDIKATSTKLTLFVRGWKKFPTVNQEGNFYLDAISLVGQAPTVQTQPAGEQLPPTGAGLMVPLAGMLLTALALCVRGLRAYRTRV